MLPENSPFNDLEAGHLKLVATHPETPQVTRTHMLPENYPFNDLEDRKLPWINAESILPKEAMLPENSPFNDLEAVHRKLVVTHRNAPNTRTQTLPENSPFNDYAVAYQMIMIAIQPETPKVTRTQMLPDNSPFNDLEDRKLSWIIADSIPPKEAMLHKSSHSTT